MFKIVLFFYLNMALSCGDSKNVRDDFNYSLLKKYTGKNHNQLSITYDYDDYQFKISGDGFSTDVQKDVFLDLKEKIILNYISEEKYKLHFEVQRTDGIVILEDDLTWEYSTEKPEQPIASFSNTATRTKIVNLLFAGNISEKTTRAYISGDLKGSKATWFDIPANLNLPFEVSASDGMKHFKLKYSNIYENESESINLQILKKSIPPKNCELILPATVVNSTKVRAIIKVKNTGPTYYAFFGDVQHPGIFKEFTSGDEISFRLLPDSGEKNIILKIRDEALSYCDDITRTVTLDPNHTGASISIDNNAVWLEGLNTTLSLEYDALPGDELEVKLEGTINDESLLGHWMPFVSQLDISLRSGTGLRRIFAEFQNKTTNQVIKNIEDEIFLNPTVFYVSGRIIASNIPTLSKLTITGCEQIYSKVAFLESYVCTPKLSTITIKYDLSDGTSLTRSVIP